MTGWICSYRKIWDHPVFQGNAERVGVWTWMLHTAAWKPTRFRVAGKVITLERGQLCASQRHICEATGITHQRLRTFLADLQDEGAITQDTTQGRTVFSIVKYEDYQDKTPPEIQRTTHEQHTKEQINNTFLTEGRASPPDPAKAIFDTGKAILIATGKPSGQAGAIVGRWRKDFGDDAALIAAISECQRVGAIDPVSFIGGCLKKHRKPKLGDKRTAPNGIQQVFTEHGWQVEHV